MKTNNWKSLKVVFIGDQPSTKNVDINIPFVGTASYKKLLSWIAELDLDITKINLINLDKWNVWSYYMADENTRFITLGNKVDNIVRKSILRAPVKGILETDKVCLMPHPSPRNRKLNDLSYEKTILKNTKRWLYDT